MKKKIKAIKDQAIKEYKNNSLNLMSLLLKKNKTLQYVTRR